MDATVAKTMKNRIIKFRIWNNKSKSWIHGPHERSDCDGVNLFGETILLGCLVGDVLLEDLNDCVALQCTGLKDINGKDIFEGDVIKVQTDDNPEDLRWELVDVFFKDGCFYMDSKKHSDPLFDYINSDAMDGRLGIEVVGNIFDNPEYSNEQ